MNTRKLLFTPRAIAAFFLAAMLVFPCVVEAELPGKPVDESRTVKVSDEEIALLLEQQKLLIPSFLAMQQKLKLLQEELDAVKLQLAQLNANSSHAALATTDSQKAIPQPIIDANQVTMQQGDPNLQKLFAALGGVLSIIVLWLGSRYYIKIKSLHQTNRQQNIGTIPKPENDATAGGGLRVLPATRQPAQIHSAQAPPAPLPTMASTARNAAPSHPPKKIDTSVPEDDLMLEEAGLYAANGRMDKAAGILQEIIKRNPAKVEAWVLLLSVYSALCKVADFESTARKFLKHHQASPSWSGIQVLGRTLDHDNPLYADRNSPISTSPLLPDTLTSHRPIGDILIEAGILSKREIQKYLDDFDPKQHGRFGGYLVARRAITIAQLDQALLQQQGVNAEAKPGDLPSLQDIEGLLAEFDPKQHGSVSKFLASRNIASPEQLGRLLRHPTSQISAAGTSHASGQLH